MHSIKLTFAKNLLRLMLLASLFSSYAFSPTAYGVAIGSVASLKYGTTSLVNHCLKKYAPQLWKKHYETRWVLDGSQPYGFFIPVDELKPDYVWWDTNLLTRSGLIYRHILPRKWGNHTWLIGLYGYCEVMATLEKDIGETALAYATGVYEKEFIYQSILRKVLYPVRGSLGCELAVLEYGLLTVTAHGMLLPDRRSICTIRMKGGVSAKFSVQLHSRLKPFICGAISYIEHKQAQKSGFSWSGLHEDQIFRTERVNSVAVGFKWIVNPNYDVEVKYFICNEQNYHMPIHIGWRISYRSVLKPIASSLLQYPPERYLPDYPNALKVLLHAPFN